MGVTNVLVFPAEGSNAIELHDALSTCVNVKLWGATSVDRHSKYLFKNLIRNIPKISEPDFIEEFNQILDSNKIDVIFPTHDTVALFLVSHANKIKSRIISGDLHTVQVCRSKIETYNLFDGEPFVPVRYSDLNVESFPLFLKPDDGQGAVGARIIHSKAELNNVDLSSHVLTEYLPGRELTVDCLTDKDGKLRYISPRTRERIMAGMSVSGSTIDLTDEIKYIANKINSKLNFLGLWYFQLREDINGRFKLLEISSRCSGTMCHTRARGINLPLLSVYTSLGYDISVFDNCYSVSMDRALIGRYFIDYQYDNVYIDFDDTITLNGAINLNVVRYLFQCRNENKSIKLLTRHANDIYDSLSRYALSRELFSEIIHIQDNQPKSNYINPNRAIFIDNAFREREEVRKVHSIPVFDVDGVEFLLDWKI